MMEDKFYKVDGHSSLVKNPSTGTILNTNVDEIRAARRRKSKKRVLQNEVNDLKLQVQQLTNVIEQLLEK